MAEILEEIEGGTPHTPRYAAPIRFWIYQSVLSC